MKMTNPVRVKLDNGAEVTVEKAYADSMDLTVLEGDDVQAVNLAGDALEPKDVVTVAEAAARKAASGGRTGTASTRTRAARKKAASKAASPTTATPDGAEADTQENQ